MVVVRERLAVDPSDERREGGDGDDDGGCRRRRSEPGRRVRRGVRPSRRRHARRAHRTHAQDCPDDVHEREPRRGHARGARHETHRRAGFDEDGERGESSEPRATSIRRARNVGEVSRQVGLGAVGVESTDEVEEGILHEATGYAHDEVGERLRVGVLMSRGGREVRSARRVVVESRRATGVEERARAEVARGGARTFVRPATSARWRSLALSARRVSGRVSTSVGASASPNLLATVTTTMSATHTCQ